MDTQGKIGVDGVNDKGWGMFLKMENRFMKREIVYMFVCF